MSFNRYPETKGPTLEELGDLFEKADASTSSFSKSSNLEDGGSDGETKYGKNGVTYVERPA